jgi:hypothetical protein
VAPTRSFSCSGNYFFYFGGIKEREREREREEGGERERREREREREEGEKKKRERREMKRREKDYSPQHHVAPTCSFSCSGNYYKYLGGIKERGGEREERKG